MEGSEPTRGHSQGKLRLLTVGKLPWEHSSPQAPPKTQAPMPKSRAPASGDRGSCVAVAQGSEKCEGHEKAHSDRAGSVKPAPGESLANVLTVGLVRTAVPDKSSERR